MSDFIIKNGVLQQYIGRFAYAVIPKGVTRIAKCAFLNCRHLQYVAIPDGVSEIEGHAFEGCENLQGIVGGKDVKLISKTAFPKDMYIRKFVLIPDSGDEERNRLFLQAIGTKNLALPFLLGTLEINAGLAEMLKSRLITKKFRDALIPIWIENKEEAAIAKLLSLVNRMSLEEIDGYIEASEQTAEIRAMLMEYKNRLYPPAVIEKKEEIQTEKDFGLREKTLADYRKEFKIAKDGDCYKITGYKGENESIGIPAAIKGIPVRIGDQAFEQCESLRYVRIGEGVEYIGEFAFRGCKNLQSIEIPKSVICIGKGAFQECGDVKSISVEEGNPIYRSENDCLIESDKKILLAGCMNSVIPSSITEIGAFAFVRCKGLQSAAVPEGVLRIGQAAFSCCENLQNITLPKGITEIGDDIFYHCESLQSIEIPDGVTSIGHHAFAHCKSLRSVTLPSSILQIGRSVFAGCYSLRNVVLPKRIARIGEWAFSYCQSLQKVEVPDGVKCIGEWAFLNCRSLETVILPNSVSGIGGAAFEGCKNLTLCCAEGSYAKRYAENKGIAFQITEDGFFQSSEDHL